jgi:hypothetical protein
MSIKANFLHHWNSEETRRRLRKGIYRSYVDVADMCLYRACRDFRLAYEQANPESLRMKRSTEEVAELLALVEEELAAVKPIYFKHVGSNVLKWSAWKLTTGYLKTQLAKTNQQVTFQPALNRLLA